MAVCEVQSGNTFWGWSRSYPTGNLEGGALAVLRGRLQDGLTGDILESWSRNLDSLSQGGIQGVNFVTAWCLSGMKIYFSHALNSSSTLFQVLVWNTNLRLVCFKVSISHHASQERQIPAIIKQKVLLNISDYVPNCEVRRHSKEFRCTPQSPETHSSELLISLDTWNADNEFVCTAWSSTRANQIIPQYAVAEGF